MSASAQRLLQQLDKVRAEKAKRSLARWCKHVDSHYVVAEHHRRLIETLERVERGECRRLIVNMPPRHGKSLTTTIRFPSWWMGRNPEKRVILACHTADLAEEFSRQIRNELDEYGGDVFGVQLADDSQSVAKWALAGRRGGLVAAGVGGPITGKGADLLLIDDPIKDAAAAYSETQREAQKSWYRMTVRSRVHPGGAIVLVMTRWHEDDLAGWLLEESKKHRDGMHQWEVLSMPMVDEDGGILWPERYDAAEVEDLRVTSGTYGWNALYQQRPVSAEGGIFKRQWWQRFRKLPVVIDEVLLSIDCAFKGTERAKSKSGPDFVVMQAWARAGAKRYLLEERRGQWDFVETCDALVAFHAHVSEQHTVGAVLVEDKANGPAVISQLEKTIPGLIPVEPDGGKEARAYAVSPYVEAGDVYLPEDTVATFDVEAFINELASFPRGKNDDRVDATTQALRRFAEGFSGEVSDEPYVPDADIYGPKGGRGVDM